MLRSLVQNGKTSLSTKHMFYQDPPVGVPCLEAERPVVWGSPARTPTGGSWYECPWYIHFYDPQWQLHVLATAVAFRRPSDIAVASFRARKTPVGVATTERPHVRAFCAKNEAFRTRSGSSWGSRSLMPPRRQPRHPADLSCP